MDIKTRVASFTPVSSLSTHYTLVHGHPLCSARVLSHSRGVMWKGCEWLQSCPCTHQRGRVHNAGDCFAAAVSSKFYLPHAQRSCGLFLSVEAMLLCLAKNRLRPRITAWCGATSRGIWAISVEVHTSELTTTVLVGPEWWTLEKCASCIDNVTYPCFIH